MDKEQAASFFYAPYWKRMAKPERNPEKQRSTYYKISAVSIYFSFFSLCKSWKRSRWQHGLISAGFTSHKPLTRFLVQRYYKCLGAYSVPQQWWWPFITGHSYPVSTDTWIYDFSVLVKSSSLFPHSSSRNCLLNWTASKDATPV